MVLLGAGAGCIGSTVNPFSVGVATAALTDMGIAIDQGVIIGFGLVLFVIAEAISIFFVMRYAKKVKADKGSTFLSLQEQEESEKEYGQMEEDAENPAFSAVLSGKQKVVLVLFALTFVVMIVGFVPWQNFGIDVFMAGGSVDDPAGAWSAVLTGVPLGMWYFNEATAWFLLMAIVIGIFARFAGKDIVKTFLGGCAEMVSVALVIALARSVAVIMGETQLDTFILTNAANALSGVPAFIFAPATFLFYFVLSFAIPSSSGMATLAMPIMGPLTNGLGFSAEVMVMIYVAAHGLVAIITPLNGAVLAGPRAGEGAVRHHAQVGDEGDRGHRHRARGGADRGDAHHVARREGDAGFASASAAASSFAAAHIRASTRLCENASPGLGSLSRVRRLEAGGSARLLHAKTLPNEQKTATCAALQPSQCFQGSRELGKRQPSLARGAFRSSESLPKPCQPPHVADYCAKKGNFAFTPTSGSAPARNMPIMVDDGSA